MKTIKDLNSKFWYRFIKVLYFLSLGMIIIISCLATFFYFPVSIDIDVDKTHITCSNDKVYSLREAGISRISSSYLDYYNQAQVKKRCSTDLKYVNTDDIITSNFKNINFIYENRDWTSIIGYSVLWILITVAFFEFSRRMFYYIVLGKIKPPKK